MNPWGYHAYNLAVHILAGLALFGLLRRTLHSGRPRGFWTALVIALIWVVHPVQTEAVTYVAERAESQMGLFYVARLIGGGFVAVGLVLFLVAILVPGRRTSAAFVPAE